VEAPLGRVEGKIAIVTGAAMGLGEASARMLAREGARVVLTDIDDAAGQAAADRIAEAGGQAVYLHHDVTEEAAWERVVAAARDRFGRLDVLVNNAGVADACPPEEQTLERWRWLMSVNLDGVFLGTKHAIRAMRRNQPPRGSIINISSVEGVVGNPLLGAYNASKGGVRLYTKSTALYCARQKLGIRVNSILPGYIWTPMLEAALQEGEGARRGRRMLDFLHPVGHVGEPDDVAHGVVYLASDEAKFVTGSELVIDGGYTAQ
jgi:NAD(P)-dependent dehydrogenase (short-subunit alcohol dehydrogenase family)